MTAPTPSGYRGFGTILRSCPPMFNGDWYACSLSANKDMLGTMARYAVEQGFTPSMIEPTEYFITERTS